MSTRLVPTTLTIVTATSDVAGAVVSQVGVAEAAYIAAFRQPNEPTRRQALVDATADGSPAREALVGAFDELAGNLGYWTTASPDGENVTVPFGGEVAVAPDGTRASLLVCVVSGDTIFVDESPGGSPEIVDSGWLASLQLQEFWLEPDGWRLASYVEVDARRGEREC